MDRDRYDRMVRALEQGVADGLIKVRVPIQVEEQPNITGETMWAKPIGKRYAKVQNIPFYAMHIGLNDVVQIDPDGEGLIKEYVRTISRGSYTVSLIYGKNAESNDALSDKLRAIGEHVRPLGIGIEGMMPGILSMAIPTTMSVQEACEVLSRTPHVLAHSLEDREQSDYDIDFSDWEDHWGDDAAP